MPTLPTKIVSGGQTGVDRAALNAAIFLELEHGGWCPSGRRAEDGKIPRMYKLKQTPSRDYSERTERNVIDSDGTLILFQNLMSRGTELTRKLAIKHRRPLLCIDLDAVDSKSEIELRQWLETNNVNVLNVAGPRESNSAGITELAERFLVEVFKAR